MKAACVEGRVYLDRDAAVAAALNGWTVSKVRCNQLREHVPDEVPAWAIATVSVVHTFAGENDPKLWVKFRYYKKPFQADWATGARLRKWAVYGLAFMGAQFLMPVPTRRL